jgi:hypothetical protein
MAGPYDISSEEGEKRLAAARPEQLMSYGQGMLGSLF